MPSIANAKAPEYRKLRFSNLDELLAEIDRVVAADREGRLKTSGNWTPGQILAHLASWIEYGYNGFPMGKPPWIIRVILGFRLKSYLENGMPRGVKIPGTKEGTFGMDKMSTEDGAKRLKAAIMRLKDNEPYAYDSPAFGKLGDADRVRLNLRHAELHLGYLKESREGN